jgi:hypothetical protein
MSNMNDLDQITLGNHAVEDLEPEFPNDLSTNTVDAGPPRRLRMNSTAA